MGSGGLRGSAVGTFVVIVSTYRSLVGAEADRVPRSELGERAAVEVKGGAPLKGQ